MRRRRQYLSVLRTMTERQAKEAADRFEERIVQRENWYEYMDESNLLSCYWIDIYWRNRNRMGSIHCRRSSLRAHMKLWM